VPRWLIAIALVAACKLHAHRGDAHAYAWDDQRVLCSQGFDDLSHPNVSDAVDRAIAFAREHGDVALLHGHTPGVTVSREMIEHVLATADAEGLALVGYRELDPSQPHRAGIALAFDDDAPERWIELRDVLARHHAHVTFFTCCWDHLSAAQREDLAQLARDGHDIEPHGAMHVHATDYAAQHGVAAYVADEVQPSIDALAGAGFPPARVYAYPWGEHDDAIDAAVLEHVERVRTTRGHCSTGRLRELDE